MMMIENVGSCAITPLFISYQLCHQKSKEAMSIYGNKTTRSANIMLSTILFEQKQYNYSLTSVSKEFVLKILYVKKRKK